VSFSWVDTSVAAVYEQAWSRSLPERLVADARGREERLQELRESIWRRSAWAETALYGSRTLRLT
jgi:hypothetical protein